MMTMCWRILLVFCVELIKVDNISMKKHTGFTLIELLIAIGIFAVFSAIAYGGLNQVLSIQQRLAPE